MDLKDQYIEMLNKIAFEIHEMYDMGCLTSSFEDGWKTNIVPLMEKQNNKLTRTHIAGLGVVTTILGDTFDYQLTKNYDIMLFVNNKRIKNVS